MIKLRCLTCGLTIAYRGSDAELCPRCMVRDQQAVRLIAISDQVSAVAGRTMGRLSIATTAESQHTTITLSGELDIASTPILDETVAEACAAGARTIVIDLGGIDFMDSTGLNSLLRSQRVCDEHGCSLRLTPAQRPVERVFELTGLLGRLGLRKQGGPPGRGSRPAHGGGGGRH